MHRGLGLEHIGILAFSYEKARYQSEVPARVFPFDGELASNSAGSRSARGVVAVESSFPHGLAIMTSVAFTTAVTESPFFRPISSALRFVITDSITLSPAT